MITILKFVEENTMQNKIMTGEIFSLLDSQKTGKEAPVSTL